MKKLFNICMVIAVLSLFFLAGGNKVKAEGAGEIEVTKIDYGNLTVCIDTAGNNICYYSKDKNKWYELEYIRWQDMYDARGSYPGSNEAYGVLTGFAKRRMEYLDSVW